MSLYRKHIFLVILCLSISACGFTPVYQKGEGGENLSSKLKTIKVNKINRGIKGLQLKSNLEDIFNPTADPSWEHYLLDVSLEYRKEPMLIERNRDINQYNIMMKGTFTLTDKATGKIIYRDLSRLTNGYRVVDSDFATLASEEDTENRIISEMAKDISFKLSDFLLSQKKATLPKK